MHKCPVLPKLLTVVHTSRYTTLTLCFTHRKERPVADWQERPERVQTHVECFVASACRNRRLRAVRRVLCVVGTSTVGTFGIKRVT